MNSGNKYLTTQTCNIGGRGLMLPAKGSVYRSTIFSVSVVEFASFYCREVVGVRYDFFNSFLVPL